MVAAAYLSVEEALEAALFLGPGTYDVVSHPNIGWTPCWVRFKDRLEQKGADVRFRSGEVPHVVLVRVS